MEMLKNLNYNKLKLKYIIYKIYNKLKLKYIENRKRIPNNHKSMEKVKERAPRRVQK